MRMLKKKYKGKYSETRWLKLKGNKYKPLVQEKDRTEEKKI